MKLIIGNCRYSTWSLRAWLLLKEARVPFEETQVWIRKPETLEQIRQYSPSGRVPVLLDDRVTVWESMAICEYVAEKFPERKLWPEDPAWKAAARSVSHEMHAGFQSLRRELPFNCARTLSLKAVTPEAQADIDRIVEIWKTCRAQYGSGGPYLFGSFTVADAMYAPVAIRFQTYAIPLKGEARIYQQTILANDSVRAWIDQGKKEAERIPEYGS